MEADSIDRFGSAPGSPGRQSPPLGFFCDRPGRAWWPDLDLRDERKVDVMRGLIPAHDHRHTRPRRMGDEVGVRHVELGPVRQTERKGSERGGVEDLVSSLGVAWRVLSGSNRQTG